MNLGKRKVHTNFDIVIVDSSKKIIIIMDSIIEYCVFYFPELNEIDDIRSQMHTAPNNLLV